MCLSDPIRKMAAAPLLLVAAVSAMAAEPDWEAAREALALEVERDVAQTTHYTGRVLLNPAVMQAIRTVPRHEFVPENYRHHAYANRPLPIGEGQTISQPYIVAIMTELADVNEDSVVLEIGTGSGYQAAVLAEIVDHVYTIEIIESLGLRAAATLDRLGYDNVTVMVGDGYKGWPQHAPFDAIIVTAAPETVPQPLIDQLAVGGKMVVPVGPQLGAQSLQVLEKQEDGSTTTLDTLPVRFVPFTRD